MSGAVVGAWPTIARSLWDPLSLSGSKLKIGGEWGKEVERGGDTGISMQTSAFTIKVRTSCHLRGDRREEMQCWWSLINVTCMRGHCHCFFCFVDDHTLWSLKGICIFTSRHPLDWNSFILHQKCPQMIRSLLANRKLLSWIGHYDMFESSREEMCFLSMYPLGADAPSSTLQYL